MMCMSLLPWVRPAPASISGKSIALTVSTVPVFSSVSCSQVRQFDKLSVNSQDKHQDL